MYFSLGRVTSPAFHSLFDRKRDAAIDFPVGSTLEQDPASADRLRLTMPVHSNAVIRVSRDYYKQTLHIPYYIPFDDRYFPTAPIVWSSWINYYEDVRERDIVRNTDWLAANLKPYGFGYVELDDGYDRMPNGQHAWIEHWNQKTFPHGPKWLATYIRNKGLHPGLWLVPNSYAGAVDTHPDWYLRDAQGEFVLDYSTPALDSTHPAVMEHLRNLFQTLGRWGFEYYKFDGEHSVAKYAPTVDHSRLHDTSQIYCKTIGRACKRSAIRSAHVYFWKAVPLALPSTESAISTPISPGRISTATGKAWTRSSTPSRAVHSSTISSPT